ncbi:MAG: conjugal transfer protein TraF [Syntrophales bacterium]
MQKFTLFFRRLVFFVCLLLLSPAVYATGEDSPAASGSAPQYNDSSRKGWWWYQKEPEKAPQGGEEDPAQKARKMPRISDYRPEELMRMHPDDFKELQTEFLNKALMESTEESVKEYLLVQDISRRRALRFAAVAAEVLQKNPGLNIANFYPNSVPGGGALIRTQMKEVKEKISSEKEDFALLYFFQPGCEFCLEQEKILRFFVEKYDWQVKKINIRENAGLAEFLDIHTTPAIFLVRKDDDRHLLVSQGVASVSEIETNLYRGIRYLKEETTPEDFNVYDYQRGGPLDVKALPRW